MLLEKVLLGAHVEKIKLEEIWLGGFFSPYADTRSAERERDIMERVVA